MLHYNVLSVLKYTSKFWTISKDVIRKIKAFELRFSSR